MNSDRPIIITGHTGVVGSYLTEHLRRKEVPLVLVNSRGAFTCDPGGEMQQVTDNVFDRPILLELFKGTYACVHLAAAQSSAVSSEVAGALFRNALLTDYFAGLCAEAGTENFVYASSGAIYYQFADPSLPVIDENASVDADPAMLDEVLDCLESVRCSENYAENYEKAGDAFKPEARVHSISPRAGYAFGKYAGELAARRRLEGRNLTVLRLANAFGPTDQEDRIIPKFVRIAQTGGSTTVFDWSRNFIWIDDLIYIIERATERHSRGHIVVNAFAPGNTIHLWDLAQMINSMTPPPGGQFVLNKEVHEPHFEFSTVHHEMLWTDPLSLKEGLLQLLPR